MAPAQSRSMVAGNTGRRCSKGFGLLAAGGVASAPLFVAPGAMPGAPCRPTGTLRECQQPGTAILPSQNKSVSGMAALAVAGAGLAMGMKMASRRKVPTASRAAAAVEEVEASPPPPPPFSPATQVGAIAPLGFFDPLGFTKVGDEEGFNQLRAAEIKHGRVAMMASIGLLGQHFIKFPGFEDTPAGLGAMASPAGELGFLGLFTACGVIELVYRQENWREAGNLGNPWGVDMYTEEMRNKEISNGRFAMICVMGIFAAEVATGKDAIQQFGFAAFRDHKAQPCSPTASSTFAGLTAPCRSSNIGRTAAAVEEVEASPPPPPPFNPAAQVGAIAPLGFFDPLGFTKVGDEEGFNQLRAAEIKHGRVAMMASIGLLGQHFIKFPGFEDTPAGLGAMASPAGELGFLGLFIACGVIELVYRQENWREAGNLGNPWGVDMYTEEMRNKEISNGRFAMICVMGIFAAEVATGKDAIQQFGFSAFRDHVAQPCSPTASSTFAGLTAPCRASKIGRAAAAVEEVEASPPPPPPFSPAAQVGAIAPLGFFDPLGFTKVGDEEGFNQLRAAEIKHGRVAMMASIGLLGQHFIKFPGFEDAPAGLGAMASPAGELGFLGLFTACGVIELVYRQEDWREAGNLGNPWGVDMYTEEMRNKEISNGRFAMICVMGIFAAEVATGKDAIQQFGL